ncbi:MAG: hypothetical protein NTW59_02245 [Candidatus Diapherotrites archaeon]|nr:hypothetical protein [Candidatus Diapherotrites archaeon]
MSRRDDEEEEGLSRRRHGKGSGKWVRLFSILAIVVLCVLGLMYIYEKLQGGDLQQRFAACLAQQRVLDERFAECSTQLQDTNGNLRGCEFQLQQCAAT